MRSFPASIAIVFLFVVAVQFPVHAIDFCGTALKVNAGGVVAVSIVIEDDDASLNDVGGGAAEIGAKPQGIIDGREFSPDAASANTDMGIVRIDVRDDLGVYWHCAARALSTKQRRMAELMAEGHTAVFAYEQAGYSGDPNKNASHATGKDGFQHYLSELQAESRTGAIMTRSKRLERLSGIASGKHGGTPSEWTRAIAEMNKMEGAYASEEVKDSSGGELLQMILAAQHKPTTRT